MQCAGAAATLQCWERESEREGCVLTDDSSETGALQRDGIIAIVREPVITR